MAGSGAALERAQAGAAEECREVVVSACFRSATSIRSVRRVRRAVEGAAGIHVARVVLHQASLRVGGDGAIVLRRAHFVVARVADPVGDGGVARVLVGDGGDRRAVGGVELGELALVGLLDGGGGADFGVLRGGVHVCVCADECDGRDGDRESECAECRFHGIEFWVRCLLRKWRVSLTLYHNTQTKTFSICKNKELNP